MSKSMFLILCHLCHHAEDNTDCGHRQGNPDLLPGKAVEHIRLKRIVADSDLCSHFRTHGNLNPVIGNVSFAVHFVGDFSPLGIAETHLLRSRRPDGIHGAFRDRASGTLYKGAVGVADGVDHRRSS